MKINYGTKISEAINILSEDNEETKNILIDFNNEFFNIDPNNNLGPIRTFIHMNLFGLNPEQINKLFEKCNKDFTTFATLFRSYDLAEITEEEFKDFLNDKITLDFDHLNKEIRNFVKFKKI